MAAAAALMLGVLPSVDPLEAAQASVMLEAELGTGSLALTSDVRLEIDGIGAVSGSEHDIDIAWRLGTLSVDVAPAQGIDLTVRTDDAFVSVVGTVFEVDHSVLGTTVTVTEGVVSVECADMSRHRITSGKVATCLPQKAHTGRMETLMEMGAPTELVLAETRRVLAMKPEKAVRGEILSVQIEVLLESGSRADAEAVAWRYLQEGHTARVAEFTSLAQEAYP
jgi:ferric-dicitrate binding protein FerR (iron transport regulator)